MGLRTHTNEPVTDEMLEKMHDIDCSICREPIKPGQDAIYQVVTDLIDGTFEWDDLFHTFCHKQLVKRTGGSDEEAE